MTLTQRCITILGLHGQFCPVQWAECDKTLRCVYRPIYIYIYIYGCMCVCICVIYNTGLFDHEYRPFVEIKEVTWGHCHSRLTWRWSSRSSVSISCRMLCDWAFYIMVDIFFGGYNIWVIVVHLGSVFLVANLGQFIRMALARKECTNHKCLVDSRLAKNENISY